MESKIHDSVIDKDEYPLYNITKVERVPYIKYAEYLRIILEYIWNAYHKENSKNFYLFLSRVRDSRKFIKRRESSLCIQKIMNAWNCL